MNSKTRSDAAWSGLSPEQRETLEGWLFDDQLGYEEALERARSELGYAGSRTSLQRFYHRTATARALHDVTTDADGEDAEEALRTGMRAIGKMFVRQVAENPEGIKDWAVLARLLLHNEENGLRREFDDQRGDTWRGWLALAREKFEFDAAEAVLKQMQNGVNLDAEEFEREKARVLAIRKRLYGRELTAEEAARGVPNA